jgi:hypothetical protein
MAKRRRESKPPQRPIHNEKLGDERSNFLIILAFISAVYIIFFANLNYYYDWDTFDYAIGLKDNGPSFSP